MFLHGVGEQENVLSGGRGQNVVCWGSSWVVGLWGSCVGWVLWAVGGFVGQAGLGVGRRPEANQACERARYACNGE